MPGMLTRNHQDAAIADVDASRPAATAIDALASPEIAYLLVVAGLVLLALRVAHPALGRAGLALAAGLLVLGGVGLHALPVAAGGMLMLVLAAGSLLMEVLVPSGFGLHAVGAAFSLLLAGLHLTGQPPGAHPALVVPLAVGAAVTVALAARQSLRYRRDRPLDDDRTLVGHGIIVLSADGPTGRGVAGGQLWQLRAGTEGLRAGQAVRVVAEHDDYLQVRPVPRLDEW